LLHADIQNAEENLSKVLRGKLQILPEEMITVDSEREMRNNYAD